MNWDTLHILPGVDTDRYVEDLFSFVALREGFNIGLPYIKADNVATIGYGFNIQVSTYMTLVLNQLGIVDSEMTSSTITATTNQYLGLISNLNPRTTQNLRSTLDAAMGGTFQLLLRQLNI